jgi:hypothetical protein
VKLNFRGPIHQFSGESRLSQLFKIMTGVALSGSCNSGRRTRPESCFWPVLCFLITLTRVKNQVVFFPSLCLFLWIYRADCIILLYYILLLYYIIVSLYIIFTFVYIFISVKHSHQTKSWLHQDFRVMLLNSSFGTVAAIALQKT